LENQKHGGTNTGTIEGAELMRYWVGVTGSHWFEFIERRRFHEVNF
jgi:hypothetical protein